MQETLIHLSTRLIYRLSLLKIHLKVAFTTFFSSHLKNFWKISKVVIRMFFLVGIAKMKTLTPLANRISGT